MLCAVRAAIHTGKEAEGERRQRSDQGTSQGLLLRRKQTNNKDSGCALCVCGTDSTERKSKKERKRKKNKHKRKKKKEKREEQRNTHSKSEKPFVLFAGWLLMTTRLLGETQTHTKAGPISVRACITLSNPEIRDK